ncbi:MAG: hypothetical protein ACK4SZ_03840 [Allosphingosinicella sp.]|uniref:hypothetical protein n=1 Tax=Allosphingosinicella sp. TaxID=2823234 RepID=UPI003925616B
MRTLLALAALATLTACGGGGESDSRRDRESSRSERDRDNDSEAREGDRGSREDRGRREADPELEDELRAEVRQFRETLPAREGVLTITDVDLDGTEIIYTGRVDADFNSSSIAEFRRVVSRDLCTGETGEVIRRGGAYTYDLRDSDGDDFETTVDSCD